jgi:hypothetical protein
MTEDSEKLNWWLLATGAVACLIASIAYYYIKKP